MSLLNFGSTDGQSPRNRNSLKLVLGIGALAGAITLGSTLAASINLNGGGNVEFGQGVATTTACDDDGITVTPFSTFINAQGAGSHKLSSIRLSGIDSREDNCEGKTFRIRAYGDGSNPLDLFQWEEPGADLGEGEYEWNITDSYDFVDITRTFDDFLWTSGGTDDDDVIDIDESDIEQTAFTLNLVSGPSPRRTPLALAGDVKKITVETFDADGEQLNNQTTSFDWLVLAAGERSVVEAETVRNEPSLHNGSYWYNTPETSRGFSLDQTVNQNGCDTEDSNANYRLCWHIGSGNWISNGYRAGDEGIDGNITGNIVRAIYTSETLPSYYPSGPQLNVLKSDLTAGGWTRCYYGDYGDSVTNVEVASCTGAYVLYAGGYPDPTR